MSAGYDQVLTELWYAVRGVLWVGGSIAALAGVLFWLHWKAEFRRYIYRLTEHGLAIDARRGRALSRVNRKPTPKPPVPDTRSSVLRFSQMQRGYK